jgi:hypothetical protein
MTMFIARDSHQGIGGVVFVSICSLPCLGVYNDQKVKE